MSKDEMERISLSDLRLGLTSESSAPLSVPAGSQPSNAPIQTEVCLGCGGFGFYTLKVPVGHPEFGKVHRCECQQGKPTPKQVARMAQLRAELGALERCTFSTFNVDRRLTPIEQDGRLVEVEEQRMLLTLAHDATWRYSLRPVGWIYLYGPYGSGKSHLAAAIANRVCEHEVDTAYTSAMRMLDWVRAGYSDHSASERMLSLIEIPLLVLDDLGVEEAAKEERMFFDLLNERARHDRPTVLTSNAKPDALPGRLADRVYEQTVTDERIIWLPVSSYRRIGR